MIPSVFALADCNNFYVSCERVFNPKLSGKPVIVLSSNDGCVIARSDEAKALGIKMGTPVFKIDNFIKAYRVYVYSSNYALYGDMSQRVMNILSGFAPDIEIYSIDEAFLDLSNLGKYNIDIFCRKIRQAVKKFVGIPVSIGAGQTKTLAKIAAGIAKKSKKTGGVLDLTGSSYINRALEMTDVEDVWGVGRSYAAFLKGRGIANALQLGNTDCSLIQKQMGIAGIRLINELRGVPYYGLEPLRPKKEIMVSRSFKHAVSSLDVIKQAVAGYVSSGAEKLRRQGSSAGTIIVFIMTSRFKKYRWYYNEERIRLPVPTCDTSELIHYALCGLDRIYKNGYLYKKAGIMLKDLSYDRMIQNSLFDRIDRNRSKKLMKSVDDINRKMGKNSLVYAAEGIKCKDKSKASFMFRSPSYTTRWDSLPEVS